MNPSDSLWNWKQNMKNERVKFYAVGNDPMNYIISAQIKTQHFHT